MKVYGNITHKHSPDNRSPVSELSGTGEAPGGGEEKASSRRERKTRRK